MWQIPQIQRSCSACQPNGRLQRCRHSTAFGTCRRSSSETGNSGPSDACCSITPRKACSQTEQDSPRCRANTAGGRGVSAAFVTTRSRIHRPRSLQTHSGNTSGTGSLALGLIPALGCPMTVLDAQQTTPAGAARTAAGGRRGRGALDGAVAVCDARPRSAYSVRQRARR